MVRVKVISCSGFSHPSTKMPKYVGQTGWWDNDAGRHTIKFDDPGMQQIQQMEHPQGWSWDIHDLKVI